MNEAQKGDGNGMAEVRLRDILDLSFRANPDYELTVFDRLPASRQNDLRDLTRDPDFYGLLLPKDGVALSTKSVCRDTALLIATLKEPGPLPGFVRRMLGDGCNRNIAELVLDGVLQIERAGAFVCGSAAYELIYGERTASEPQGKVARLTRAALYYGQDLDIEDSVKLSARLYFYNRLPLTPSWQRQFPDSEAVMRYLGIENPELRRAISSRWTELPASSPETEGWLRWSAQSIRTSGPANGERKGFKLYLSPQPHYLRDAFKVFLECLADSTAHHFKVGSDGASLLRPDKIVAYFPDFNSVQETAQRMAEHLAGMPSQGVPFTAQIGTDGLLSWGLDPPEERGMLSWQERPSWRLWITNRLATALVAAKYGQRDAGIEPWQFAVERLRLEHIDTDTWTPDEAFGGWQEAAF